VLAFIPAAGSFVEAKTLGGPSGQMIGNVIADQIGSSGNAPLGAALSLVLLLLNLVIVSVIALPASGLRDRIARRRTAKEA
jgi:spermidine/putrescine transport system permease protein